MELEPLLTDEQFDALPIDEATGLRVGPWFHFPLPGPLSSGYCRITYVGPARLVFESEEPEQEQD